MPIGYIEQKQFSYVAFFHQVGGKNDHGMMSLLYLEGLLKDHNGEAFYCPSEQSDDLFMFNSNANPWVLAPTRIPHPHLNAGPLDDIPGVGHCRYGYQLATVRGMDYEFECDSADTL